MIRSSSSSGAEVIENGWNWLAIAPAWNEKHLALERQLEGMELAPERLRAEADEDELAGDVRQRLPDRLHHDLGHELVQPVGGEDAIAAAPDEQVPEDRAVEERCDPERGQHRHVDVQRRRQRLRPVGREDVVGRDEEDDAERALHVDEHLVPEPHEQREQDRDRHRAEREDAGEDGQPRSRAEQLERRSERDRRAARQDQDDVPEEEDERGLPEDAMHRVHPVEAAEEMLHGPKPRAEHEIEGERGRARERAEDREARQRRVLVVEAHLERSGSRPEHERSRDERRQQQRPSQVVEPRRHSRHSSSSQSETIRLV